MRYILFIAFFALCLQITSSQENQVEGFSQENYPDYKEEYKELDNFFITSEPTERFYLLDVDGYECIPRITQKICTREMMSGRFFHYSYPEDMCGMEIGASFGFFYTLLTDRERGVSQEDLENNQSQPFYKETFEEYKQCLMEIFQKSKINPTYKQHLFNRLCFQDIPKMDCQNLEENDEKLCLEDLNFSRQCMTILCFENPSYEECSQKCRHLKHPLFFEKWNQCKLTGEGITQKHFFLTNP